jgi:hypothetical protein
VLAPGDPGLADRGGWNDPYRVETADDRNLLRVRGAGRHSLNDIRDALEHVHR